jgi:hypothetical protein
MSTKKKPIMANLFILLFSVLFLNSCSSAKLENLIPVNEENINNQIILRAPNYANNFKVDRPVIMELKNTTEMTIVFPRDFNIQLFVLDKNHWVEIHEQPLVRFPADDIVLSGDNPTIQVFSVFPEYPESNKAYYLRIYVIGELRDEMKTLVAGYIDINVNK